MRVAVVHNRYQYPGGEDRVFEAEAALLASRGHVVETHEVSNDAVASMGRLEMATKTIWNREQYALLRKKFRRFQPHVVHVHNTLPLVSPAVYYAATQEGAAVVQTLHNYRLICPSGLLHRSGVPCELCVGRTVPWPGVLHKCYRSSRGASAVVAAMLASHRVVGTYQTAVHHYIALTKFSKALFVKGGLTEDRITVKPNFVSDDPGRGSGRGEYALFVGRLSHEKGIDVLLRAWERIGIQLPLRIIGDGPEMRTVVKAAAVNSAVVVEGPRSPDEVREAMKEATFVVVPSIWYETFGLVVIEALAVGTPVLASRIGALEELVADGVTGSLVAPGDANALADAVLALLRARVKLSAMRRNARATFLGNYTADHNYAILMDIYGRAEGAK